MSNEGIPIANIFFGKGIIRNETEEPTEFTELNKHADISTDSSIRLYQNSSKEQTSQATPKDLQDSLFKAPISTEDLIIKYKYHELIQQAIDSIIKDIEDGAMYNYESNANIFHIAIISKISADITECSSIIPHNDEASEKNSNDINRNEFFPSLHKILKQEK